MDELIYFSTEIYEIPPNDSPYYHIDYNVQIGKGIEIIKKICNYNLNSQYREELLY